MINGKSYPTLLFLSGYLLILELKPEAITTPGYLLIILKNSMHNYVSVSNYNT